LSLAGLFALFCAQPLAASSDMSLSSPGSPEGRPAAAQEAPAPPLEEGEEHWHRKGVVLRKGESKIELVGYVQPDFRYFTWEVEGDKKDRDRDPGFRLRRLRMGSKAQFGKVTLGFVIDPRSSKAGSRLKDVTAGYAFSPAARLMVGYFKPSIGLELLASGSKLDFAERSMAANILSPDRDWGGELSGSFGRLGYVAGLFAGDGNSHPESARTSASGRLMFRPVPGLELAGSILRGEVRADNRALGAPKGLAGESATGFTFWDRPYVNGTRRRLGSDLSYSRGPFRVQAEYLEARDERNGQGVTGLDLPDVRGRGWNAQVSYVVTGEPKEETVVPRTSLFKGGKGALELVARVEGLGFDDLGPRTGSQSFDNRAADLVRSGVFSVQLGANYWAATFMKIQSSALWEKYNDGRIAPAPVDRGPYFTLVGRVQFIIP